jgi:RNA polymerase sigma-70 factor (ECF subfamily)
MPASLQPPSQPPSQPPGPPSPEIDARIAAAARGDRAAAQALLTELLPRVRNLVRYLVRGDRDVDDMAQEALIAIARGLAGYRGEGTLTAWADRIAARTTFAYLRRERRAPGHEAGGADLASVPHPDDGPDQYAERRQLVRLLDQLPDDQRYALVLHHAMGLSVPEMAETIGVPAETVRSRLRLGKARLRALTGARDEIAESDERSEP